MRSQGEQVAISDVIRDVVAQVAPAELHIVDSLLAEHGADITSRYPTKRGKRQQPLGFGLGDMVVLVTPVVWVVVEHIAGRLADSATDGVVNRVRHLFRRRMPKPHAVRLPLTPEQLAEVRQKALEAGARQNLTPEQSEHIANAIIARLIPRAIEED